MDWMCMVRVRDDAESLGLNNLLPNTLLSIVTSIYQHIYILLAPHKEKLNPERWTHEYVHKHKYGQ